MGKSGKLFGKISIVDLIVILVVLIVAAGTIYRFTSPQTVVGQGDTPVEFVVRIEGVRNFTTPYYVPGLRVYDGLTNQFIGRLVDTHVEPHYPSVELTDGSIVYSYNPNHVVIYVRVEANGRATADAILIEGTYEITANSNIFLQTRYIRVQGIVYSVELVN
ncbi:MAG: DUF4330 domain-containing protein [Clostridiales bacterium]|jgi:hypothetical protein|nr:DUF4330 domain-containing protein [Clostridiales bacterium]